MRWIRHRTCSFLNICSSLLLIVQIHLKFTSHDTQRAVAVCRFTLTHAVGDSQGQPSIAWIGVKWHINESGVGYWNASVAKGVVFFFILTHALSFFWGKCEIKISGSDKIRIMLMTISIFALSSVWVTGGMLWDKYLDIWDYMGRFVRKPNHSYFFKHSKTWCVCFNPNPKKSVMICRHLGVKHFSKKVALAALHSLLKHVQK